MKNDYRPLLAVRLLREVVRIFSDSFLILYFVQLADGSIIPVGLYNLLGYTAMIISVILASRFLRAEHRIYILRGGIIANFVFFVVLLILRERAVDFSWLLGIIAGIGEGLFCLVYNIYVSNLNDSGLPKYFGWLESAKALLKILIPLIFGGVMDISGSSNCILIVAVVAAMEIWSSWKIADYRRPTRGKTHLKEYLRLLGRKNDAPALRAKLLCSHLVSFSGGLCYDDALNILITVYIIRFFTTGLSLGILTSIFAIVTTLAGASLSKILRKEAWRRPIIIFCHLATILSLILVMISTSPATVIFLNFVRSFSLTYIEELNRFNVMNISHLKEISKQHEEYFIAHELFVYVGRMIGYTTFLCMDLAQSVWGANVVMAVFIAFLVFQLVRSLKLDNAVISEQRDSHPSLP